MKRKKTSVAKREDNPQYKESFNFRVEPDEIEKTGLKVCFRGEKNIFFSFCGKNYVCFPTGDLHAAPAHHGER